MKEEHVLIKKNNGWKIDIWKYAAQEPEIKYPRNKINAIKCGRHHYSFCLSEVEKLRTGVKHQETSKCFYIG